MDVFNCLLAPHTALQGPGADTFVLPERGGLPTGEHLPLLQSLFPGCAWLTVPQVAACLKLSAGHIYNLHSTGRLPFKMTKNQSGRLRASVWDIAAYMDSQQTQTLLGKRLPRGPRLRWLHAANPLAGVDTDRDRQDNGAHP